MLHTMYNNVLYTFPERRATFPKLWVILKKAQDRTTLQSALMGRLRFEDTKIQGRKRSRCHLWHCVRNCWLNPLGTMIPAGESKKPPQDRKLVRCSTKLQLLESVRLWSVIGSSRPYLYIFTPSSHHESDSLSFKSLSRIAFISSYICPNCWSTPISHNPFKSILRCKLPLILSIFPASIFSPTQDSPSTFCA